MKIAAFGDVHAHIYKDFDSISDRTGSSRLDNILDALIYMRDYCVRNEITTVLFGGDMYHIRSRVNTIVFNSVYDTIKSFTEIGIKIVMIPGNHDDSSNADLPSHSLHAFKDIEGVTVVDTLTSILLEDGTPLVCVRYSKNARMIKDYIASIEDNIIIHKKAILLGHLGINGGFVGKGNYPMADAFEIDDLRPDLFKYVLLGHYHRRQFLGDHLNMLYMGAPIQHSFSDEGEDKGFVVIDTSRRYDIQFVPIPSPSFITLSSTDVQYWDFQQALINGDYFRIQVAEKYLEETLKFIPEGIRYKVELQREYLEQTRVDVKIGMSDEEVVTKYANEFSPKSLQAGLKILSEVKGG